MSDRKDDNPDRAFIARVLEQGLTEVDVDSSALLRALKCQVVGARAGEVHLRFLPGAQYEQGNGVVSGGIIATMLDFGMAFAGLTTCAEGESVISVGLTVTYVAPVHCGPVLVEASLLSSGFRLSQAEARLTDTGGNLLAKASSPLTMKRRRN